MKLGKDSFILLLIFSLGLAISVFAISNRTSSRPKAEAVNLNTASEIGSTTNADGTMGPSSLTQNWSSKLAQSLKGKLELYVTDPLPAAWGRPSTTPLPTESYDRGSQGFAWGRKWPTTPTPTKTAEPTTGEDQSERDGPQTVDSLVINFYRAEVHLAGSKKGEDGENSAGSVYKSYWGSKNSGWWELLNISGEKSIDLVALAQNSASELLGNTDLAAGKYTEIRIYVSSATATIGGKNVELTILGKDKIVRVVNTFTVIAGQTTKLTVDFDAQHSVIKAGDKYLLRPVVARLIVE
ncbi:MAG: DUF4382 domain-containing protein [bacterium]|nr:DUF4382 domain-containing protein [bacterium]